MSDVRRQENPLDRFPEENYVCRYRSAIRMCPTSDLMKLWRENPTDNLDLIIEFIDMDKNFYNEIADKSEELHERMIIRDPSLIEIIENPSKDLWLAALIRKPAILNDLPDAPTYACEFVIHTHGACTYKYIRRPTKELLIRAMLSDRICRCGCLASNPQSDLEEAIFEAILIDIKVLVIVTFANDHKNNYAIRLDDDKYIALGKIAASKYGLEKVLKYITNNSMKCKIEQHTSVKNARSVI